MEPSVAADFDPGRGALYSYASVAVAALQVQAQPIETLRGEVAKLRHEMSLRR